MSPLFWGSGLRREVGSISAIKLGIASGVVELATGSGLSGEASLTHLENRTVSSGELVNGHQTQGTQTELGHLQALEQAGAAGQQAAEAKGCKDFKLKNKHNHIRIHHRM